MSTAAFLMGLTAGLIVGAIVGIVVSVGVLFTLAALDSGRPEA